MTISETPPSPISSREVWFRERGRNSNLGCYHLKAVEPARHIQLLALLHRDRSPRIPRLYTAFIIYQLSTFQRVTMAASWRDNVPSPSRSGTRSPAPGRNPPSGTGSMNIAVPDRIGALGTTSPGMISPPSGNGGLGGSSNANDTQYRPFAIPYPPQSGQPAGRAISPMNPSGGKKQDTNDILGKSLVPIEGGKEPRLDEEPVVLGICAMDIKARSKAMREILTRLVQIEKGGVVVKMFGDMVILEEGRCSVKSSNSILSLGSLTGSPRLTQKSPIGPLWMSSFPSSPPTFPYLKPSRTPNCPTPLDPLLSASTR